MSYDINASVERNGIVADATYTQFARGGRLHVALRRSGTADFHTVCEWEGSSWPITTEQDLEKFAVDEVQARVSEDFDCPPEKRNLALQFLL